MRDYFNPLVLLIVVAVFAWGMSGEPGAGVWAMMLCVTAFLVNGALCLARILTHRAALMSVIWSAAYLILGSCAWVMLQTPVQDEYEDEKKAFQYCLQEWKNHGKSPFDAVLQERECLVVLAAGLGKQKLLTELLALPEARQNAAVLQQAAAAAVENGKLQTLRLLLQNGVSADAVVDGTSLLSVAVIQSRREVVEYLLECGAKADCTDADGISAVMHAVINDDLPSVRLLMRHGANPAAQAPDGRDAYSCSRTAEMDAALMKKE